MPRSAWPWAMCASYQSMTRRHCSKSEKRGVGRNHCRCGVIDTGTSITVEPPRWQMSSVDGWYGTKLAGRAKSAMSCQLRYGVTLLSCV